MNRLTRRTWLRSISGVAMLSVLAACTQNPAAQPTAAPAPKTGGTAVPPAAKTAQDPELERLITAAKQEGELVLLGPPNQDLRTALNDSFGKQFGVNVSYFGGSNEHFTKLRSERAAGQYTADVVINAATTMFTFRNEFFDPVKPQLTLKEVTDPSQWIDDHLWWVDQEEEKLLRLGLYAIVNLVVNPDHVKPDTIKSWDDVLNPQYKGKITTMTPLRAGPGGGTASYLWLTLGEDKFRKLYKDQAPVFTDDARTSAESVARGTHPIGLGLDASVIEPLRKQGLKLEVVRPPDAPGYLSTGWATFGIINRAPHPNAARAFANWAASKEGGTVINRPLESLSTRKDVSNDWAPEYTKPRQGTNYLDTHVYSYLADTRAKADAGVRAVLGA